ncbi:MAG: Lrp/AsnC ligand binding domain-containing protein [bacterium]
MAVNAYILIEAEGGKAGNACITIRSIPGIKSADAVTGLFDIIALAQADNLEKLGELVVSKIQRIDGVQKTQTAVVVPLEK